MADLAFRLIVKDDGTAVVQGFDDSVDKSVGKARKAGRAMSKAFKGLGRTINSLPALVFNLRNAVIGLGAGLVLKSIINTGRAVQRAQVRLIGLKGGVDAANEAFANFQRIASGVAFSLEDVVEAGVAVEAFGAKSEDVLESVIDLAAFMGTALPEAASAFGRAFAGGAGAADVLRERGVLTLVQLRTGLSDLTKLTLPEFREAMLSALRDPAGPIADSAKLLAETVEGQLSFIGDAIFKLKKRFFEAGVGSVFSELATNITIALNVILEVIEKVDFSALGEGIKDLIPSAQTMVDLFFGAGKVILALVFTFKQLRVFALIAAKALLEGFGKVVDFWFDMRKTFQSIFDFLARKLGDVLAVILEKVADAIFEIGKQVKKLPIDDAQKFGDSLQFFAVEAGKASREIDKMGESSGDFAAIAKDQKNAQDAVTASLGAMEVALNSARASTEKTARAFSALVDGEVAAAQAVQRLTAEAEAQKEALDALKTAKAEAAAASKNLAAAEIESVVSLGSALESFQMGFNARSAESLAAFIGDEQTRIAAIKNTAEQDKASSELNSKAGIALAGATAGTILKIGEQFGVLGLENRKAVAIAEAVVNTAVGITRAFAELGPFGAPVAALIAATGAAQIAAIAAARPGTASAPSAGGAVGGEGGGGGGAIERPEDQAEAAPMGVQEVNIVVTGFVGNEAELASQLSTVIRDAVGDGVDFGLEAR